jgi:phage tail sheath protein FI
MARRNFTYLSPQIQIDTIDKTGRTDQKEPVGPTVIGRAAHGPAMIPITSKDEAQHRITFGAPIPGGGGGDIWRDGNRTTPTYGAYAASAWLKNSRPLTFVRLLGFEHSDATAAGKAGWETQDSSGTATGIGVGDSNGGAYGLFICDSASAGTAVTGTLAAVWYITQGSIGLSGSLRGDGTNITGSAVLIGSTGANQEFKAIIRNSAGTVVKETAFNFSENSDKFIRKVFNADPTLTNAAITNSDDLEVYWLGETFEKSVAANIVSSSANGNFGVILGLKGDAAAKEGVDYRFGSVVPQTGWVMCQDLTIVSGNSNSFNPETMTKLFRFHGLHTAEWEQANIKISVEDIRPSANQTDQYGTFSVVVRKADDFDNAVRVIERFANLTLNPRSDNFLGKRIGDKYLVWDETERRYDERGEWENNSSYIRVELNSTVRDGNIDPLLLPFGFYGPVRHKGFTLLSGSSDTKAYGSVATSFTGSFVKGSGSIARVYPLNVGSGPFVYTAASAIAFTASYIFPALPLRSNSNEGNLANPKDAFFGITSDFTAGSKFNKGYADLVRALPAGYNTFSPNNQETEYAFIFTLDDVSGSGGTHGAYSSGSRAAGTSLTAVSGTYKGVLDRGFNRFTMPMYGGFDGLDITEKDPFRNTLLEGGTETTNYAFNSVKRAIDAISDAEDVDMNLLSMPGLTNEALTSHIVNVAADRGDTLSIVDLKGGYQPTAESTATEANRLGSYTTVITNLRSRGLNSNAGCAYYPWLRYRDEDTGQDFWGPPSIAALGTFATTEDQAELWYAPAGYNRGDLSRGKAGGIPVVGVRENIRNKERDSLYDANINPITKFPGGRIVVYGQKTLQLTQSALDRVNIKRLELHIKRELSRFAQSMLFDQNVKETWNRFLNVAQPFLDSLITRFGLEDARLVLDETTTTPDLRDRNIVYAKVQVVPVKAIEAIFIDLEFSESGVTFA